MSVTSIPYFVISIIPTVPGEVVFMGYHSLKLPLRAMHCLLKFNVHTHCGSTLVSTCTLTLNLTPISKITNATL